MVAIEYLGRSGLKVSEITYGNWITHGSQVENDAARSPRCTRPSTSASRRFDTADTYAEHGRRGRARRGPQGPAPRVARRSSPRCTSPSGPKGAERHGPRASTSASPSTARCAASAPTTSTSTRRTATTTRRSLEETMQAFADVVRQGKALYIGVLASGPPTSCARPRAGAGAAASSSSPNQPQYSALWRVIEGEVVPASRGARHLADRVVADGPGRAHAASTCRGSPRRRDRARPTRRAAPVLITRFMRDEVLDRRSRSSSRSPSRPG